MSDAEKATQIGQAVTEYQRAKTEAAHIQQRLRTVLQAYKHAGEAISNMMSDRRQEWPKFGDDGVLTFGYGSRDWSIKDLLNAADLEALIRERDAANLREKEALELVRSLGITGIS